MFFVGATGQLLTLMLTVCLPFVFLFSGHQNIEIADSSNQIEIRQIHHEVSLDEINAVSYFETNTSENQQSNFVFEKYKRKKTPLREFNIGSETFYIDSSGNKAPPLFYCFC